MKTRSLIFVILLLLSGCEKEKAEAVCAHAEFVFVNQAGEDIFNDLTQDHLTLSDFSVTTSDSVVNLNYYRYFDNDTNFFDIGLNGLAGAGTTYFRFGNLTVDTIFAKFEEQGNSIFIKELYYNGDLIEENKNVSECGGTAKLHVVTVKED